MVSLSCSKDGKSFGRCGHPVERCVAQCGDTLNVTFRVLWIRFKFPRLKVCVVVGYGPNEGNGEERERFWNELDRIVDRLGNGYRSCVVGDFNLFIYYFISEILMDGVGDKMRVGIIGAFGVPGENDNGRVVDLCAERELRVWVTQIEH